MKKTVQSILVLDAVRRLHCHASADDIYEEIAKDFPTISRGTVYRNLNRLSELGEIKKRELPGGADGFDHRCDAHYHARCEHCGHIFDVDIPYFPGIIDHITDKHGFIFTGADITFKCICPDCQNQKNSAQKVTPWNA